MCWFPWALSAEAGLGLTRAGNHVESVGDLWALARSVCAGKLSPGTVFGNCLGLQGVLSLSSQRGPRRQNSENTGNTAGIRGGVHLRTVFLGDALEGGGSVTGCWELLHTAPC